MNKTVRVLLIFLAVDALALGVYFLAKSIGSGKGADPTKDYAWVTMDPYYQPASELEEYIKTSSDEQELLPLQFRNYGQSVSILKKFRGSKLVGAGRSVLEMTFPKLEDWALVDIWIRGEEGREIRRTVLYILADNAWKAGDSGRLVD